MAQDDAKCRIGLEKFVMVGFIMSPFLMFRHFLIFRRTFPDFLAIFVEIVL